MLQNEKNYYNKKKKTLSPHIMILSKQGKHIQFQITLSKHLHMFTSQGEQIVNHNFQKSNT